MPQMQRHFKLPLDQFIEHVPPLYRSEQRIPYIEKDLPPSQHAPSAEETLSFWSIIDSLCAHLPLMYSLHQGHEGNFISLVHTHKNSMVGGIMSFIAKHVMTASLLHE